MLLLSFHLLTAAGTVLEESFYSESLDEVRSYSIYLPEGYLEGESHYPVLYFLHYFGGDHTSLESVITTADSMAAAGEGIPMIIVKPDASTDLYLGSFYTNSELNGDFEDYIVDDFVTHIDNTFRTIPHRRARGISGFSMGGYGAMKLSQKHPQLFSSISSHSGTIAISHLVELFPAFMDIQTSEEFEPIIGGNSMLVFGYAAAFSPNLSNPPYYVDIPLTTSGEIVQPVFDLWLEEDPLGMAMEDPDNLDSLAIFLDCGEQDELFISHSEAFHTYLESENIDHWYGTHPGGHGNNLADRFPLSQLFHSEQFQEYLDEGIPGDVDGNLILSVSDIVLVVGLILDEDFHIGGDISGDYNLCEADIALLISYISDL